MIYDEQMHQLGEESIRLNIETIVPTPDLQKLIYRYFVLTQETTLPLNSQWYLLPDNSAYLIFYLFDQGVNIVPKWTIIGPRSKHKIISRENRLFTFICSFKPGGLSSFVDIPIYELRDQAIDACYMLKNFPFDIFEKLTMRALRFNILGFVKDLEFFLVNSMSIITSVSYHIAQEFYQYYLDRNVRPLLTTVSKDLGYSDRQLRNLIQNYIGHSPKMVAQIERFTKSLVLSKGGENWANIAYSAGYYDQSHMISDYHKLVGSTPEKLFS